MNDEAEPHGLMVIHLWIESGDRLRARITRTGVEASSPRIESYAASKADVVRAVEDWVGTFVTPP
jgi:hypothetical protein